MAPADFMDWIRLLIIVVLAVLVLAILIGTVITLIKEWQKAFPKNPPTMNDIRLDYLSQKVDEVKAEVKNDHTIIDSRSNDE